MQVKNNKLYLGGIAAEELVHKYGSPLYVYEEDKIRERYLDLVNSIDYEKLKIYYACKANTNLQILQLLRRLGACAETVSKGEILAALRAGFTPQQLMFTCSSITKEELAFAVKNKIKINIDSLNQLKMYGEMSRNSSAALRINQGIGAGHHRHVITGGPASKFGIYHSQIGDAKRIAKEYGLAITSIHQHIGSNVLDEAIFLKAMKAVLRTAEKFKDLEAVDFGGGFGVPYMPNEKPLNMQRLGKRIADLFSGFCREYGSDLTMIFEPGRYLVCEAGFLLATVVDTKKTPGRVFAGVDSGFNHLVRPIMYGSYHPIMNATSATGGQENISLVGNICESGDMLAQNRKITKPKCGDVIAVLNAGAYGFSMSSNYNMRPRPAEVLVEAGNAKLIRKRETFESLVK